MAASKLIPRIVAMKKAGDGNWCLWTCACGTQWSHSWTCGKCAMHVDGTAIEEKGSLPTYTAEWKGHTLQVQMPGETVQPLYAAWPWDDGDGCEACAFVYREHDIDDPCNGGGEGFWPTSCAYYSEWLAADGPTCNGEYYVIAVGSKAQPHAKSLVSLPKDKWPFPAGQGCEMCAWYKLHMNAGYGYCIHEGGGPGAAYAGGYCGAEQEWRAAGMPLFPYTGEHWPKDKPLSQRPWPDDTGCLACHWQWLKNGHIDPCSQGNPNTLNPSCYRATSFVMATQGLSEDAAIKHIAAVKLAVLAKLKTGVATEKATLSDGTKVKLTKGEQQRQLALDRFELLENVYTGLTPGASLGNVEQAVAQKLGVDWTLDLANACATFYVLEAMMRDLWPAYQWEHDAKRGRTVPNRIYPLGFIDDADTRTMLRAYAVKQAFDDHVRMLTHQFSTYLQLACGGELRHFNRKVNTSATPKVLHCKHECSSSCCAHVCALWPTAHLQDLECGCKCKHMHSCDIGGCDVDECCSHVCSADQDCWHEDVGQQVVTDRITKYLKAMGSSGERTAGWKRWHMLSKRNPAVWMKDCARVFLDAEWAGGYGGVAWGRCADITAGYLAGDISEATFVDRCWSMQHNGGHIFNKVWRMDTVMQAKRPGYEACDTAGRTHIRLDYVLNLQAKNEYDELARFSSVSGYWAEHKAWKHRDEAKTALVERWKARV